jgi:hypothetical protein
MKDFFLTFGAVALPAGLFLITLGAVTDVPIAIYYLGWTMGSFGIIAFFVALRRSFKDDQLEKERRIKSDENVRDLKKALNSIHGELEGLRGDVKKWKRD